MNETILLWINQGWAHPWLDPFFTWVSERGTFSFPLLLGILLLSVRQFKRDGVKLWLVLLAVIVCGDQLGNAIKHLTAQPRPCYELHEIVRQPARAVPGPCGGNLDAMPSNHALNFFATATFIMLAVRIRSWGITLYVIALLVGISRIYLGKHYPSQVLAGAMIGCLLGYLAAWLGIKYLAFMQRVHIYQQSRSNPVANRG
jgi:undecaprenyl-diphosphatase